jgi:hypothetical protein
MKRFQSSMFVAAACALTVSVSAQTPPPAGVTQPTFGADKKVTITGCLERSKESTASDRTTFMLNNIVPSSPAAPAATGTAGTSGSEKAPRATSYRLDGEDSKLSPHVGHKMEITGTVEDKPMSATGTPVASGSGTEAPKFKVETVKMIASSCAVY